MSVAFAHRLCAVASGVFWGLLMAWATNSTIAGMIFAGITALITLAVLGAVWKGSDDREKGSDDFF